ncbi:MAG: peptide chain release factor aRF-1 [Candidatus Thermoplasmatota archaeon]|nr:peptide chain release factor 1 [Euryarchaeota archaeon]MBU4032121.1 peptide chain release factor aRF-1 [Candidatus Thermoplasmatota archaeon]MBU4070647.1 peptide chain release factor aRF-1 [Candidatus Thermoplasmatota archaeon]MBU4145142.1 peptide chain release factor aRF-1 [Candidatus Thermoplasmatota archaeon]MBU4591592.1 peptide chain release factor aRF-1 [Candidatus Thermoplasmatota archaeon]
MTKSKDLLRYEFKKQLREIQSIKGRATELISLYVPPEKRVSDVTGYLRNEYAQSSNIKSRTTKKNVMWAIDSISGKLKTFKNIPENGLVFLVGHRSAGGDQTVPVSFIIQPPEPITTFLYRCDSHFYLEQLEAMLTESEVYGLIVIDRNEATIGILNGRRIEVVKNFQSMVMGKHKAGGQSAQRFERLIEISVHEYFKNVAEIANDRFMAIEGLKGVIIGGPGSTKVKFMEDNYLHHELMKRIIGTFEVGYTDEYGLKELMHNAEPALADLSLTKEKKLINRFLEELRKPDGGHTAYGEAQTREAMMRGAIDTLLISEGMQKDIIEYTCPKCGKSGNLIVKSLEHVKCPECNSEVEITKHVDMINDLYELADSFGTNVEIISMDFEEGEMLMKAFNGLAAILRYKLGG